MFIWWLSLIFVFSFLLLGIVYAYDIILVGKVPFVSLDNSTIVEILKQLDVKPNAIFYDLGCGDGRVLVEAARLQPKAEFVGVEKSIRAYLIAKLKTASFHNIKVYFGDVKEFDFQNANTVFVYLMPELLDELTPKLQKVLSSNGQVVAVEFGLPKLKPQKTHTLKQRSKYANKWYLY